MGKLYLGLISGTSIDGVDAAIVDLGRRKCRVVAARTTPYPVELRARVQGLIDTPRAELREIGALDVALGRFFGACADTLVRENALEASSIEAIGHHGQTVYHEPLGVEPFSLQLGDPNSVAALTGIVTVADFRRRDMASGGQGAPLVSAFHEWLFRAPRETRVIVNIGGIANVTILEPGRATLGFDTGPGNTLLDAWTEEHRSARYDEGGSWAASGTVDASLLQAFLREPYFALRAPKSTGRELFHRTWLERHLESFGRTLKPEDVQATLVELTATTIVAALAARVADYRLIVCGGGAHNRHLMARLRQLSGSAAESTAAHGVEPDWIEAAAFAWLARARLKSAPGNVPSVTGARKVEVLGGVYYGAKPETNPQSSRGCPESQTA